MTERILLDANTLLNAAFVSNSWSRRSVAFALQHDSVVLVGQDTTREAVRVARKISRELGKKSDPEAVIEGLIRQLRLMQVSADPRTFVPREISHHDSHVYREAFVGNAAILTSDSELWLTCKNIGAKAYLPLEIIRKYAENFLVTTVFGVPLRPESGSVFLRGYPTNWGGHVSEGKFTLVDFPDFLWIYYDAQEKRWTADLEGQECLHLPQIIRDDSLQTVVLSWKVGQQLIFRSAGSSVPTARILLSPLGGTIKSARIGSHRTEHHFWNGAIYLSIYNDRPVSKDAWHTFLQDRDLAPNPFDMDRLRQAIWNGLP
jgi:hypothetical protein